MIKNLNLTDGQEDLRIVDHLDMHKLPESVQQMISLASTPEEQEIKPLDQRKVLFEQLKEEDEHRDLINEAKAQGISARTAFRWNEKWQEEGLIIKEKHGLYRKAG